MITNTKTEEIIGYVLLGAGLIFILLAAYNVYTIFTGVSAPPEVFKMKSIVLNVNNNAGGTNSVELVSGKVASKFMDMSVWYILMFFLVQAGSKIASLGIQMVKKIKVIVKSKDGINIPAK